MYIYIYIYIYTHVYTCSIIRRRTVPFGTGNDFANVTKWGARCVYIYIYVIDFANVTKWGARRR